MIDFLDNADKVDVKNRAAPSDLPASLLLCQIWIIFYYQTHLVVCVSNYTEDTEDTCLCVKLYCR